MSTTDGIPLWSPLMCLPKATLTPSGLLQLDTEDGEVELIRRSGIELRSDSVDPMKLPSKLSPIGLSWVDRNSNLTLTVTTHRLVFSCKAKRATATDSDNLQTVQDVQQKKQQAPETRFIHLMNVQSCHPTGGPTVRHWNASYKMLLVTVAYGDLAVAFRGDDDASAAFSLALPTNPASFKQDRDDTLSQLEKALGRRAWETAARIQHAQKASSAIAKRKVGVDAIMTKSALKHKEAALLADRAVSGNAEQLLQDATELARIIRKYVTTLEKQSKDNNDNDETSQESQDARRLASMLQDMGMISALTKQDIIKGRSSEREYYELVARQVADFLLPKLPSIGGIMTLTDVYCLYNRARGSNLLSPDDLVTAMKITKELDLDICTRSFPSGIVVVQLTSFDDTIMAKRLLELINQQHQQNSSPMMDPMNNCTSITALEASRALKTSPLLAQEHLEAAERMGYLCRDVTLQTTRFFKNSFDDFVEALPKSRKARFMARDSEVEVQF